MNTLQKKLLLLVKANLKDNPIYAKELLTEVLAVDWEKGKEGNVTNPYYVSFDLNLYDKDGNKIDWKDVKGRTKLKKQGAEIFLDYALGRKGLNDYKKYLKYSAKDGRFQILLTAYYVNKIIRNIEKYQGMANVPRDRDGRQFKGEDLYLSTTKKGKWNEGTPYSKERWEKIILDSEKADNLEKLKDEYRYFVGEAIDADAIIQKIKSLDKGEVISPDNMQKMEGVLDSIFNIMTYARDEVKPSSDIKKAIKKCAKDAEGKDALPELYHLADLLKERLENMTRETDKDKGDELVPKPKMLNNRIKKLTKIADAIMMHFKKEKDNS